MKLLFNFSIDLAKELSDVNFIWRVHPLYKDYNLKNLDVRFCNLPDNIIISNGEIGHTSYTITSNKQILDTLISFCH
jgi:hypothetical protein